MKALVSRAPQPLARTAGARAAPSEARMAAARRLIGVQPMLTVGAADDPLEHEAERTAERVVSMTAPPPAPVAPRRGDPAAQPLRRTEQPNLDQLETDPPMPAELQEPTVAATENVPMEKLDPADMAEIGSGQPEQPAEVQPLRRAAGPAAVGPEGGAAPASVSARVANPGPGRPLPRDVAGFMEPRFGVSFADVRVHDQPADRQAAARIGARAFTLGARIWLGPGERVENRRLLAHELTHVVQQTKRGPVRGEGQVRPERIQRGIMERIEEVARYVPGYTLLTVILGRSPITGQTVPRTAENLIGGVLGLIPGGTILVERLRESHALQKGYEWVVGRLADLNLTWDRVSQAIGDLLSLRNLASPREAVRRHLGPILDAIIAFAIELKDKILELIVKGALALAGPRAEQVWNVFKEARDSINLVLEDPLRFAGNLFSAVGRGFRQFGSNILDHLKRGMMGWLFGALGGAGLQMPAKLDLKGLMSIGLQVVGLTWRHFRTDIVRALEPHGEAKVGFVERAVGVVQTLMTEGFAGIWRKMLELIDGFKQTVLGGLKTFITQTIVTQAITWLASLTNPIGGIVRILKAAYDIIVVFLERMQQILELVRSIFSSIRAIAQGNIEQAANFVEQTMGRTVPIIISFLAGLLGLGGISGQIRNVIQRIQAPVARARIRLVTFLVKKAKQLISRIIQRLNRGRRPPKIGFRFMGEPHEMSGKVEGPRTRMFIASGNPRPVEPVKAEVDAAIITAQSKGGTDPALGQVKQKVDGPLVQTGQEVAKVKPESTTENSRGAVQAAQTKMQATATDLTQASEPLKSEPRLDAKPPDGKFVRAVEPRPTLDGRPIEGTADTYSNLAADLTRASAGGRDPMSVFYERDHLPGKAILFGLKEVIEENTVFVDTPAQTGQANAEPIRVGPPPPPEPPAGAAAPTAPGAASAAASDFGALREAAATATGEGLFAIILYRPIHRTKTSAGTMTKEAAKALITQTAATASTRADKVKAVGAKLRERIETEVASLVRVYAGDAQATAQIRNAARAGLDRIMQLNENFNLKAAAGGAAGPSPTAGLTGGSSAETGARGVLTGGQIAAEHGPEGDVKAYNAFGARGVHTEADHVLEKAFPLSVLVTSTDDPGSDPRTFGDEQLVSKLGLTTAGLLPNDLTGPARARAQGRLSALKGRNFNAPGAGPLRNGYNLNTALTMLLYRVLAARVTNQTRNSGSWRTLVDSFGDAQKTVIRNYVLGVDGVGMDEVRRAFRAPVEQVLTAKFQRHMDVIRREYTAEMTAMRRLNPRGPRREAANRYAQDLMARIDSGEGRLRGDVQGLF